MGITGITDNKGQEGMDSSQEKNPIPVLLWLYSEGILFIGLEILSHPNTPPQASWFQCQ